MSTYSDLTGKNVVVTGANGDIGLAACEQFLDSSCRVFAICHHDDAGLIQLKAKHPQGELLDIKRCDISDRFAVEQLIVTLEEEAECVHVLINNAGICRDNLFSAMSYDEFDRVMQVNLYGTFNMCKSMLRLLRRAKGSAIVNVSSISGITSSFGQVNYSAAKAGVNGFTRTLAAEYGSKGIRVNAVAPGMIESKMVKKVPRQIVRTVISATPLRRLGLPAEIASVITFLSSEASAFVVGQTLVADGGLVMR
ncbi:SDR family oxidoreductase [Edaphovirga cremea]|jgi:3-oxoacyl-[acyl-carrier protein] reductase|uniref:SDR family oxidoreductase n=1 Tax=Edaphovirga cremea TaxID=2267246 RepID=UPI000DEEFC9E|nr:SDR family NAD(P)-dependent oxidoreductase [Edaphovirga cremea]